MSFSFDSGSPGIESWSSAETAEFRPHFGLGPQPPQQNLSIVQIPQDVAEQHRQTQPEQTLLPQTAAPPVQGAAQQQSKKRKVDAIQSVQPEILAIFEYASSVRPTHNKCKRQTSWWLCGIDGDKFVHKELKYWNEQEMKSSLHLMFKAENPYKQHCNTTSSCDCIEKLLANGRILNPGASEEQLQNMLVKELAAVVQVKAPRAELPELLVLPWTTLSQHQVLLEQSSNSLLRSFGTIVKPNTSASPTQHIRTAQVNSFAQATPLPLPQNTTNACVPYKLSAFQLPQQPAAQPIPAIPNIKWLIEESFECQQHDVVRNQDITSLYGLNSVQVAVQALNSTLSSYPYLQAFVFSQRKQKWYRLKQRPREMNYRSSNETTTKLTWSAQDAEDVTDFEVKEELNFTQIHDIRDVQTAAQMLTQYVPWDSDWAYVFSQTEHRWKRLVGK